MRRVWYVYPIWHKVSFSLVGRQYVRELAKYLPVEEIDENTLPLLTPSSSPLLVVHPLFYVFIRFSSKLEKKLWRYSGVIGVDVADSDRVSKLAVSITNYTDALVVPSNFSKKAMERSGVRVPVYVVPHGLPKEWYSLPRSDAKYFTHLAELKKRKGLKYVLYFLWHSEYRKGADLVIEWYRRVRHERKDVVLIVKTMTEDGLIQSAVKALGGVVIAGWLTEEQKRELFDLCDAYTLFTRGGGFEMNGLEAIGRGLWVLAPKGGAWDDYLPSYCLLKSHRCPYVLKDNPIHVGGGVEVDVPKAVDTFLNKVDDLEEMKRKCEEYRDSVLKHKFTWSYVGRKLYEIIVKYF